MFEGMSLYTPQSYNTPVQSPQIPSSLQPNFASQAPGIKPQASQEGMQFGDLFDQNTLMGLGKAAALLLGSKKQFAPPQAFATSLGSGGQMQPQKPATDLVNRIGAFSQFRG